MLTKLSRYDRLWLSLVIFWQLVHWEQSWILSLVFLWALGLIILQIIKSP